MENEDKIRGILAMLESIERMARESSLTGAMNTGAGPSIKNYNNAAQVLVTLEVVDASLFPPLPEDSSFDEVGVSAKQLSAYVKGVLGWQKENFEMPDFQEYFSKFGEFFRKKFHENSGDCCDD